jgi:hypothetical protein
MYFAKVHMDSTGASRSFGMLRSFGARALAMLVGCSSPRNTELAKLTNERKLESLEIAHDNKTDKDIQRVKDVLMLDDIYRHKIMDISWSYDRGIFAKQTAVHHGAEVAVDESIESQANL